MPRELFFLTLVFSKTEQKAADNAKKKDEASATKKAVKKVKEKLEKTTLGDITELAALKDQMEAKEEEEKNN